MVQTEMGGARNIVLDCLKQCRNSRKLVLVIVAVALLLDNMLLSTVVPIIPAFLLEIHHEEKLAELAAHPPNDSSTTTSTLSSTLLVEAVDEPEMLLRKASVCSETEPPGPRLLIPISYSQRTTSTKFMESTTQESLLSTEEIPTTRTPESEKIRHDELVGENVEVGLMFASKPIVQALTNPFIGPLTSRLGYTIPMFAGFVIMFISTIIFSLGKSYATLFIARSLQGVGSACTSVAGMGMLADLYPDDRERGNAMAVALGGLALGVLIGPPFGGVMYEFVGKSSPFLVLAALALFDGVLQLFVLQPCVKREEQEGASIFTLIKDPYILIAAGAITFANMGIAILEPSLPLWMMDTMNAPKWQQGAAFLPASISYLIGTNVFGPLGHRIGRWLATLIGLLVIGACLMMIPLAKNVNHLITPNAGIGFAIGMVDSSMMPMLGHLVDLRHTSVYGSVYAIGDVAFCMGFAVGPALSGAIVKGIGFKGLVYCIAVFSFCYAPLMFFLRNPPGKDENQSLIMKESSIRYVTYTNEDSPDEEKPPTVLNNHTDWVK